MKQKTINFRDPVVERVVDKFVGRSDVGYKKYGVTLEEDPSEMQLLTVMERNKKRLENMAQRMQLLLLWGV